MAINLADNIRVGQQKPIDDKYFNGLAPYDTILQANTLILPAVRHRGLTVNIAGVEYWYEAGIADNQLIEKSFGIPTLQQVLDNNHNLIDNNNFQGTSAGDNNSGVNVSAFGDEAAKNNSGGSVNAFGSLAAKGNSGDDVNAFGAGAGLNNTFSRVTLFGQEAQADADNQMVFAKQLGVMARFSFTGLTISRKYDLPNNSGIIALISDITNSTLNTASGDASGTVSGNNLPLTLATVNPNVGSFGSTTLVPVITINAKGLVTAVSTATIPVYTLAGLGGQPQLNGTGFVKISGTTISYDNNTYTAISSNLTSGIIPKATGVSTLADSQIQDNGTTLGIGGISTLNKLTIIDTALAGTGLTGSLLDLQQTWNTVGNPTAIKLTVTNAASGTAALLLNLIVGTISVFNVNKFGDVGSTARIGSITSNRIGIVTNTATASQSILSGSSFSHATGSSRSYYSTDGFVSSGAAEFAFLEYGGTINQSTGGTGITRGLYINPSTFTSVADFRAIETTKGTVYLANALAGTVVPSLLNLTQTHNATSVLSNMATFNYIENPVGSGSTTPSGFMRFNLNGTGALTFSKTGAIYFGASFGASGISGGNPIGGASLQGGLALNMYHNLSGTTVGYGFYMRFITSTRTPTTDENGLLNLFDTFAPTTGTASHNAITINNTINQTAGVATGITRGLYVNPVLTAAADYRAIEVSRGSIVFPYQAVSATYAIKTSDYLLDFTSGTFTATLPTAVGCTGKTYVLKNSGTGVITIATTSSQTIDGVTPVILTTQYSTITVVSNGTNWISRVNCNNQQYKNSAFTAQNDISYIVGGTGITITDPVNPIIGRGFSAYSHEGSMIIGGITYTVGSLVYRYYRLGGWVTGDISNISTISNLLLNKVDKGVDNATTTALSSATLNSTYPDATTGFKVYCTSIIAGKMVYEKTPSGWVGMAAIVP